MFAVFAVCQLIRPKPWRSRGAPVRSLGSVEATCEAWRAIFRDFPIKLVIPASEIVVNCRP